MFYVFVGFTTFVGFNILLHILKLTNFIFVGLSFSEGVGGQMYADVECLMHILMCVYEIFHGGHA